MHEMAHKVGALGQPRGMGRGGSRERGFRMGTHVHLWRIHVDVRQKPPQYCTVISLQLKFKNKLKKKKESDETYGFLSLETCKYANKPSSHTV